MSFPKRGPALLPALLMLLPFVGGLAPATRAQTTFVAALRGNNEVPPVNTNASGTATLVLSADETSATLSLNYSGLSSAASAAHVHGPADPGVSASPVKDIPREPFSNFVWTFAPVGSLSVQDQVNALKGGRLYINVHSANYPNGEIRGQFFPAGTNDSYAVTASPSTVAPGGNLTVSWTAPAGRPSTDWVGLYRTGAGNDSYVWADYTGGTATGSRSLAAPAQADSYEFRYFLQDGYTLAARSGPVTVGMGTGATSADVVRFLEQATFGPTKADIDRVTQIGFPAYLNEQFAAPLSGYDNVRVTFNAATGFFNENDFVGLRERFFQNAVQGSDQLRQRVAFALNQILVVSAADLPGGVGNAGTTTRNESGKVAALLGYQKVIHENALGNYRNLLYNITLNSAMGRYLNMANNVKASSATAPQPNENYARELLQLFSIGVFVLNTDGTLRLDPATSEPIPTYGNAEITNFARALTGWTYARPDGTIASNGLNALHYGSMALSGTGSAGRATLTTYRPLIADRRAVASSNHDSGAKRLLDYQGVNPANRDLPAGRTAQQDLDAVINNVYNHPNVGPFICKQLIQHLVTSNPSRGYVQRVVQVFNSNRSNPVQLQEVVKAILLDSEARGDLKTAAGYGHLREPALFITSLLRALNATGTGANPFQDAPNLSTNMGQNILNSPTVFNFYLPDYRINVGDQSLLSPEAQLLTTETVVRRVNFVNTLLYGTIPGVAINISEWQALAGNPAQLVDALNQRLMHGAMPQAMRDRILTAVNEVPAGTNQMRDRARIALYLIGSSMQYQVQQ